MSIRVMSEVWEHSQQEGTALLMLLAIADSANDERRAWPSVATLARKTRMSERNARYLLRQLEDSKEIECDVAAGPHGSNVYTIKQLSPHGGQPIAGGNPLQGAKQRSKRGQPIAGRGGKPASKVGQPIAPNPSLTVIDPSENLNAAVPRKPRESDLHFEALADLTGLTPPFRDWKRLTRTAAGQLHQYAKELREVDATPEQIAGFKMWFSKHDWRGREGQAPTPADVVKLWSQYLNGDKQNGTHNSSPKPAPDPDKQARLQRIADEINRKRWERERETKAGIGRTG